MKHALRALVAFLIALFLIDIVSNAALNVGRAQFMSHLESGAWWPNWIATLETFEFMVYAILFAFLGAVFSHVFKHRVVAAVLALLLGGVYSAIGFALEPDLPFVRYSHAPAWLWVLSWSQLYVPPIACVLGAVARGVLASRAVRARHAA